MARIDLVGGTYAFATAFFSRDVTLHVCQTNRADGLLERKAGDFLYPPHTKEDYVRLGPLVRHRVEVFGSSDRAWDDIVIAGFGWIAVSSFGTKELDVWVPKGVKVFRRPALMPGEVRHRGVSKFHFRMRARGPRMMRKKRGIVQARRDKELRDALRTERACIEAGRAAAPAEVAEDVPFVEEGVELKLPPGYSVASGVSGGEHGMSPRDARHDLDAASTNDGQVQ
eukprot:gnl/TRDRNA2_/TRDRNA2_124397_c3_seq1.p1 gnl/TRDRNA2_/TRDRNA2_124397_c3~~gnl/TRDRNA2_/TRDRNA2_124397_c3_seq1.p1  ORF type:complete len:247 (+),score=38.77 gnl/TRDRNA2_/TRDRNA2_124397_c3_seq1:66-743(+)